MQSPTLNILLRACVVCCTDSPTISMILTWRRKTVENVKLQTFQDRTLTIFGQLLTDLWLQFGSKPQPRVNLFLVIKEFIIANILPTFSVEFVALVMRFGDIRSPYCFTLFYMWFTFSLITDASITATRSPILSVKIWTLGWYTITVIYKITMLIFYRIPTTRAFRHDFTVPATCTLETFRTLC